MLYSWHVMDMEEFSSFSGIFVELNEFHLGLQNAMKSYVDKYYTSQGVYSDYCIDVNESETEYTILLYAERIQLQKFHAGSWTARYFIKKEGDAVSICAKISLHAHAFENGNLQLKSIADFPETETTEDGIFKQMLKWDEKTQSSLSGVYNDMSCDILKKFRRVMPVTKTRFDWNLQAHRGIQELGAEVHNREG